MRPHPGQGQERVVLPQQPLRFGQIADNEIVTLFYRRKRGHRRTKPGNIRNTALTHFYGRIHPEQVEMQVSPQSQSFSPIKVFKPEFFAFVSIQIIQKVIDVADAAVHAFPNVILEWSYPRVVEFIFQHVIQRGSERFVKLCQQIQPIGHLSPI